MPGDQLREPVNERLKSASERRVDASLAQCTRIAVSLQALPSHWEGSPVRHGAEALRFGSRSVELADLAGGHRPAYAARGIPSVPGACRLPASRIRCGIRQKSRHGLLARC